jgi:hypothetical protein
MAQLVGACGVVKDDFARQRVGSDHDAEQDTQKPTAARAPTPIQPPPNHATTMNQLPEPTAIRYVPRPRREVHDPLTLEDDEGAFEQRRGMTEATGPKRRKNASLRRDGEILSNGLAGRRRTWQMELRPVRDSMVRRTNRAWTA